MYCDSRGILQNLTCKTFFSTNHFNTVFNEAPILTIPHVNDVACVNGSVALTECIEHEYAWLKKFTSNVIGEEQESICY
jgi:hypothetical protein